MKSSKSSQINKARRREINSPFSHLSFSLSLPFSLSQIKLKEYFVDALMAKHFSSVQISCMKKKKAKVFFCSFFSANERCGIRNQFSSSLSLFLSHTFLFLHSRVENLNKSKNLRPIRFLNLFSFLSISSFEINFQSVQSNVHLLDETEWNVEKFRSCRVFFFAITSMKFVANTFPRKICCEGFLRRILRREKINWQFIVAAYRHRGVFSPPRLVSLTSSSPRLFFSDKQRRKTFLGHHCST